MALNVSDEDIRETMAAIYDSLESNVPKSFDDYRTKRKKLAIAIHDIERFMDEGTWRMWSSWDKWDFTRIPITYCFECHHPVKLKPTLSQSGKELKKLECEHCGLIHYDSRYD